MDVTLSVYHKTLSVIGISIFAREKWDSIPWLIIQTFMFIYALLILIFCTVFMIQNYSDLLICIQAACVWNTGILMFICITIFFVYRKKFRTFLTEIVFQDPMLNMPFIEQILKLFLGGKLNELKQLVIYSQDKLFKLSDILIRTYLGSFTLCYVLYTCKPIYRTFIGRENKDVRIMAFEMWFPWGLKNDYVYVASFLFNLYGGYICCLSCCGLQSTIFLLFGQMIRQLKVLIFILQNLDELVLELTGKRDERWQKHCTLILSQCVDHYIKLKRFNNRLNVICQPFYLALILDAIMLVCVCFVKIAISDRFSEDTLKYYIHAFCIGFIVMLFCFLGQQLKNECDILENVVLEKWYIFDKKHKVCVQIFKMAVSHGMPVYIFGSVTLTLPTFTWFIRSVMSFFMLVMTVLEDDNNN
uniref:Odorant receptor n=1 Tax=Eogystia hippophaecolus TaxID=1206364 RepID=A0A1B3P5P1_EOGHI|nr:odorant receptor [Eogystia hippophaecolus]